MSLIIIVYTNEGIIMASDSRTTYNRQDFSPLPDGKGAIITQEKGIHYSDTTYKTFLTNNNIGISTCGDASIDGKPIAGYVEKFINNIVTTEKRVSDVPHLLIDEFNKYKPVPNVVFHVAGYEQTEDMIQQKIYRVFLPSGQVEELDTASQGAAWDGETEILSRIITINWIENKKNDGTVEYIKQVPPPIPWNFLSLQDAIDFSMYAMNTTMETMRFQERLKTVGGPVDILAIKPSGAIWIVRKELHAK